MKTGMGAQAFTIVEILIVMAVTGVLIVSAFTLIVGQQSKTQFNQSINDIQSQVNQIIGNVENGYYARSADATNTDFSCSASAPGYPNIFSASSGLGTEGDCTFVGKAIQFGVSGTNNSGYNVYGLVGLRDKFNTSDDVTNVVDASPVALYLPGDFEQDALEYGLQVHAMKYSDDSSKPSIPTGIVAFMTDFAQVTTGGSNTAKLYALSSTSLGQSASAASTAIGPNSALNFDPNTTTVSICLDGTPTLYAILTIGSNNRQLTTTLNLANKSTNPVECR